VGNDGCFQIGAMVSQRPHYGQPCSCRCLIANDVSVAHESLLWLVSCAVAVTDARNRVCSEISRSIMPRFRSEDLIAVSRSDE
jgi:hypothetical protein